MDCERARREVDAFTIVVAGRRCCLGRVVGEEFVLAAAGSIVQDVWNRLPNRFATIMLDAFAVMPNHVHGIVVLGAEPGFSHEAAMMNVDLSSGTLLPVPRLKPGAHRAKPLRG